MLQESTKTLIQSILRSLERAGDAEWDDQIESGKQCLYEMHQMTRPSYKAYRTTNSDKWPSHIPDAERLNRAMPHVKSMVSAIRRRDHATAVDSGKAALAEMCGVRPALLTTHPAVLVSSHVAMPVKARRPVAAAPRPARTTAASSN